MTDDNDVQYEIRIVKIRFNVTAGWIDCCRDNYWASLLNFNLPQGPIHALAFSPSGKFLASGATDGRVLLWDIGHGLMVSELKGHTDTIYTLKFSRDGEILASGGWPTASLNFTSVDNRISTVQMNAFAQSVELWRYRRCITLPSSSSVGLNISTFRFQSFCN